MTFTDKHIVEAYTGLLESLSYSTKAELIDNLSKSLKSSRKSKKKNFFNSFGAFASKKPAETIIKEIRLSRKFRNRKIKL